MIYGLLLAAGTSSRMGQPKQLLDWRGQPLVRHVALQALHSQLDGLVVVVGAQAGAVRQAVGVGSDAPAAGAARPMKPLLFAENEAFATGQASSLRVGLAALPASVDAVLVLLVDQPLVTTALLNHMVAEWRVQTGEGRRERGDGRGETGDRRPETGDGGTQNREPRTEPAPPALPFDKLTNREAEGSEAEGNREPRTE
ncbi:MAG: nucleotidyltransferase family protein, partial [Chloroflexaceae bacterium]|nr:nucleotidyltransferase family protein [Chloroflexaceae bacterium]